METGTKKAHFSISKKVVAAALVLFILLLILMIKVFSSGSRPAQANRAGESESGYKLPSGYGF